MILWKDGEDGYANSYVEDVEYQEFKRDVNDLLGDKNKFTKRYLKVIGVKK